jgi:glycosyltransferase involved in cell wall biosynthesis
MSALPVTALVASRNEGHLLGRCLESISFCDELIVIDIDSDDDTAAVAAAHGARVLRHGWVPIAERARIELAGEARYDWLLFADPDEVWPGSLALQIVALLPCLDSKVAVVDCPLRFYFRGRPLRGTVWGGVNRKRALARRDGVELRPTVTSGTRLRPGRSAWTVPFSGDNAIRHDWAPGYRALVAKHRRYLRLEGPDRRNDGLITGYRDIAATPLAGFYESFVRRAGYRDGATGLALSLLWSAYSTGAKVALLRELRRDAR